MKQTLVLWAVTKSSVVSHVVSWYFTSHVSLRIQDLFGILLDGVSWLAGLCRAAAVHRPYVTFIEKSSMLADKCG